MSGNRRGDGDNRRDQAGAGAGPVYGQGVPRALPRHRLRPRLQPHLRGGQGAAAAVQTHLTVSRLIVSIRYIVELETNLREVFSVRI